MRTACPSDDPREERTPRGRRPAGRHDRRARCRRCRPARTAPRRRPVEPDRLPAEDVEEVALPRVEAEDEEEPLHGRGEQQRTDDRVVEQYADARRRGPHASGRANAADGERGGRSSRVLVHEHGRQHEREREHRRRARGTAARGRSARGGRPRASRPASPRRTPSRPTRTPAARVPCVADAVQRVDEPRLDRAGVEGEAEAEERPTRPRTPTTPSRTGTRPGTRASRRPASRATAGTTPCGRACRRGRPSAPGRAGRPRRTPRSTRNTWKIESPARSRNSVLTPQMIDVDSVKSALVTTYVPMMVRADSLDAMGCMYLSEGGARPARQAPVRLDCPFRAVYARSRTSGRHGRETR